jgi:serine/threonine-protein kinase SRPK3
MSRSSSSPEPPQPVYIWIPDVENLEQYEPGGYHPVHIDDEIQGGRYRILHKLGYGS